MADSNTIFELHGPKALRNAIRNGDDFQDYEIDVPGQEGKVILRVLPWGKLDDIDLPEAGLAVRGDCRTDRKRHRLLPRVSV